MDIEKITCVETVVPENNPPPERQVPVRKVLGSLLVPPCPPTGKQGQFPCPGVVGVGTALLGTGALHPQPASCRGPA